MGLRRGPHSTFNIQHSTFLVPLLFMAKVEEPVHEVRPTTLEMTNPCADYVPRDDQEFQSGDQRMTGNVECLMLNVERGFAGAFIQHSTFNIQHSSFPFCLWRK